MSPMNPSDAYYRALLAYKKITSEQRECRRDARAFSETEGFGRITVMRYNCTVDEEWIRAIETGLVHIEKAIKEERQFIYSHGEVIPIEKVKNVSKDSVEHLARHADLITRVEEGKDLIPDKLYTVERLSDYAVYENRFLYMLLCYLRDFVTIRYQKILELTNHYDGHLTVEREVQTFGRTVTVKIDLTDERRDDPYLREHNPARDLIDRMDLILKTILAFLATPLMESAGKVAMLKPPITKTNVLKMDNNFKGAVALYDYIIAYEGDGYTVEENIREIDPFGEALSEDMAEAELLLASLTYRYGLDLNPALKRNLERDEAEARMADIKLQAEQLEAARRRMERAEESPEAYVLRLEKYARALERENDRMPTLYAELETRRQHEAVLSEQVMGLTARVDAFEELRREDEERHVEEMTGLRQAHRQEQTALVEAQSAEKARWMEQTETERARHREETNEYRRAMAEKQAEMSRLGEALEEETKEKRLLHAQVMGQRAKGRSISPEEMAAMTDQEQFDELERELEAFVKLYGDVWKQTKRKIRKELLNPKYIKGQSGKS